MACLLRIVKDSNFAGARRNWQTDQEAIGALRNFTESDNKLSLFAVTSREDVRRACVAFALTHPRRLYPIGYRVVNEDRLAFVRAKIVVSEGGTICPIVNGWHRDLVGASESERLNATFQFGRFGFGGHLDLLSLKSLIKNGYQSRHFALENLGAGIRGQVELLLREVALKSVPATL